MVNTDSVTIHSADTSEIAVQTDSYGTNVY